MRLELGNRDQRSPDPQLLAYSKSLMAAQMKRNNVNAKLCLSYSLAYPYGNLLLERRHARDVEGLVGTARLVWHIFQMACRISSIQLYAVLERRTLQRGRKASFQSVLSPTGSKLYAQATLKNGRFMN